MKTVIVTGGSRGIGAGIVKFLAEKGYNVILNYNKSELAAIKIKKELLNKGLYIEIYKADVSNIEEIKNMIEYCIKKYKNIDVLINNAGISEIKEFTHILEKNWNNMINVNLNSVYIVTKQVVDNMIHNKNGCIINISSVWGIFGASMEVHYSTAKAGVIGFTKSLARELGPSNIRVNAIAPGIIDTDMNKDIEEEYKEALKSEIPLGRFGKVEEIAKCVNWLIEDNYTTGQVISIDGGWK